MPLGACPDTNGENRTSRAATRPGAGGRVVIDGVPPDRVRPDRVMIERVMGDGEVPGR